MTQKVELKRILGFVADQTPPHHKKKYGDIYRNKYRDLQKEVSRAVRLVGHLNIVGHLNTEKISVEAESILMIGPPQCLRSAKVLKASIVSNDPSVITKDPSGKIDVVFFELNAIEVVKRHLVTVESPFGGEYTINRTEAKDVTPIRTARSIRSLLLGNEESRVTFKSGITGKCSIPSEIVREALKL